MRQIKIFIGSSIMEHEEDRQRLENFIYKLSEDLGKMKSDISITPYVCNEVDVDSEIEGSEMCFFLFYDRAETSAREEIEVAYRIYSESQGEDKDKRPKIYIYFKEQGSARSTDGSIEELKDRLDRQYQHFFCNFNDLDTVKLRMLLNLKFQELNMLQIDVKDGLVQMNGRPIEDININNVMEFMNNGDLRALEDEYLRVEAKYLDMLPEYTEGGCPDEFCKEFAETDSKRKCLREQIEEIREQIFELSLSMSRSDVDGDMTPRLRKAYRLLEKGDVKGCLKVLDEKELDDDFLVWDKNLEEQENIIHEERIRRARNYIRENELAIETLKTMYDYAGRLKEIVRRYDKIVPVAEKYVIEIDVILDYANYLSVHSNSQKAEELYLKVVKIYERLAEAAPKAYEGGLAASYNNLASLYLTTQRTGKAEEFHLKAIGVYERLAEADPKAYEGGLAASYNNLASLYLTTQRTDKAEEFNFKALEIRKRLAEADPKAYEGDLAASYNNLASLYLTTQRTDKAEEFHLKAIGIMEMLSTADPKAYEGDLALSYNNLARLYSDTQRTDKAEEFYLKAIEIQERLAEADPKAYEGNLALYYNNLADLYYKTQRTDKGDEYLLKELGIMERLAEADPKAYEGNLAHFYNNLADLYSAMKRPDKAKKLYHKAEEINRRIEN